MRLSMLAGLVERPFGTVCITDEPLYRLPFILAPLPLVSESLFSRAAGDLSEGRCAAGLDVGCEKVKDDRSLVSEAYAGIIRDSWTVTLIKEAAFPERCGGGVDGAWEARVVGVAWVCGLGWASSGGLRSAGSEENTEAARSTRGMRRAAPVLCRRVGENVRMGARMGVSLAPGERE